jgi:hypothetical protein
VEAFLESHIVQLKDEMEKKLKLQEDQLLQKFSKMLEGKEKAKRKGNKE